MASSASDSAAASFSPPPPPPPSSYPLTMTAAGTDVKSNHPYIWLHILTHKYESISLQQSAVGLHSNKNHIRISNSGVRLRQTPGGRRRRCPFSPFHFYFRFPSLGDDIEIDQVDNHDEDRPRVARGRRHARHRRGNRRGEVSEIGAGIGEVALFLRCRELSPVLFCAFVFSASIFPTIS